MAKYIDLHNLKENLTNFLNKKIDPIYAKKTEVPQGTVVDDALSSTSTNPVQNKVVKAEFDQVNSNLYTLAYDENAGWKNLFRNYDSMGYYAFIDETYNGYPVIYSSNQWDGARQTNLVLETGKTYTVSAYVKGSGEVGLFYGKLAGTVLRKTLTSDWQRVVWTFTPDANAANTDSGSCDVRIEQITGGETYISCFKIEEGATVTPYEPYIPSVKMLAEENEQQNNSLSSLGKCKNLLKPTLQTTTSNGVTCTNNGDGTYTLNGTKTIDGVMWFILGDISLKANTSYKLIAQSSTDTTTDVRVYDNDGMHFGEGTYKGATPIITPTADIILNMQIRIGEKTPFNNFIVKPMLTTNLNATYDDFVPYTGDGDTLTADVAELKNDLSDLKDGTTPAAKAVADEDENNIKSTYAKKTEAFIDYSHISVDLNTLTKAPSLISIGYDIDNKPPKFMGGYMLVVNAGYPASIALYQILFDVYYNKTYQRKYYHGSWSAWSDVTTPQDAETTTLTTTSGTATLYKLGKMRHLVLNDATFSSTAVLTSTDASVSSLYFRAEVLFNSGDDLEGGSASFEDICIGGSNMWNATRTATGASPVAVKGATGSATWMVQ